MKAGILNTISVFLFSACLLHSQSCLVSEYYNTKGSPAGEWTELFIIQDNISLVGHILRDNAASTGSPDQWQGGISFRDVPLWRHLRKGTIIVINHRGTAALDSDPSDGYIEISAENDDFFEKVCYDCTPANWRYKALSIAQECDMVQIASPNLENIHCLSHMSVPSGDYLSIGNRKVNYPGSIGDSSSVRVVPGDDIADYYSGSGLGNSYTGNDYITKGLPNKGPASLRDNEKYWRQERQPEWNFYQQKIRAVQYFWGHRISWDKYDDPYPLDSTAGYLLLRINTSVLPLAGNPIDSRIYAPGDKLGSAEVLFVSGWVNDTVYYDYSNLNCGDSVTYRLYIFRYGSDDLGFDTSPENARGRSYNEQNYLEIIIEKKVPDKPTIMANKIMICQGDTTLLCINDDKDQFTCDWFRNDILLFSGKDSIIISKAGTYQLRITDTLGCFTYSDKIEIRILPKPVTKLFADGKNITSDTTIELCYPSSLNATVSGLGTTKWFKDNNMICESDTLIINSSGIYSAISEYYSCAIPVPQLTIRLIKEDMVKEQDTLSFQCSQSQVYDDRFINIYNRGNDTLKIVGALTPQEFVINSPPLPFFIPPEDSAVINIRFIPSSPGFYSNNIILLTQCGNQDSIFVNGFKEGSRLIANHLETDFGIITGCLNQYKDSLIRIHNKGKDAINILSIKTTSPFEITPLPLPITLNEGDSLELKLCFRTGITGEYKADIYIVYETGNIRDSILLMLKGTCVDPNFSLEVQDIDLGNIPACRINIDTSVFVRNTGKTNITIDRILPDTEFEILNSPLDIGAGETKELLIRYKGDAKGYFSESAQIFITECQVYNNVSIHGNRKEFAYALSRDTIDFGNVPYCNEKYSLTDTISIINNGDTSIKYSITNIRCEGSFTTDIAGTIPLNGDTTISINFEVTKSAIFDGKIHLAFEPCGIEKVIYLKAGAVSPEFLLTESDIDFGNIQPGKKSIKILEIYNSGDQGITIESIEGIEPPFYISDTNPPLPAIIKPGQTFGFNLEYRPETVTEDLVDILVRFNQPCDSLVPVVLRGTAKEDNNYHARLQIRSNKSVQIGEKVRVPVEITAIQPDNPSLFGLDSIFMELRFDPEMLYSSNVFMGDIFGQEISVINTFFEKPGGFLEIMTFIEGNNTNIKNGRLLEIEFLALDGKEDKSEISYCSAYIFANRDVSLDVIGDTLVIEGRCNFPAVYEHTLKPGIIIEHNNGKLTLKAYVASEDPINMYIADSRGKIILILFSGSLKPGKYEYNIPFEKFAPGAYFGIMVSGQEIYSEKFICQ